MRYNNVNQPDILFASALKMTGYLRRYAKEKKNEKYANHRSLGNAVY